MNDPVATAPAGPERRFLDLLGEGRFEIQQCADCRRFVFYPRSVCPHCSGTQLDWVAAKGSGTVYATTTVRRPKEAGGDYEVTLVDLDEGVRMMSTVEGLAPGSVPIGLRVVARVAPYGKAHRVVFRPLEGAA